VKPTPPALRVIGVVSAIVLLPFMLLALFIQLGLDELERVVAPRQ
jgi:hypothetical protein